MASFEVTTEAPGVSAPQIVDDDPAPIPTPLISLKKRQDALKKSLYIDLKVPRWDDVDDSVDGYNLKIYCRYKPIDGAQFQASIDKREKQSGERKDWMLLANADALVNSCLGVYGIVNNDYEHKLSLRVDDQDGSWTKFDPDLARALELPDPDHQTAVIVCRTLYKTDGDLTDAASRLIDWSSQENEKIQEDFTRP